MSENGAKCHEEQENKAGTHKQSIVLPQIMDLTVLTNSAIRGEIK